MIELAKHIEYLLLDNDCVVIPELGGFIAHYQPARYEESEGTFLPPFRSIGFNPQLRMNDGLLVQSYMQAYHTDFSDALHMIENTVNTLKETLYSQGIVEIYGIGTLHYNIYGTYEFQPLKGGALTPSLYGLDSFCIAKLPQEQDTEKKNQVITSSGQVNAKQKSFHLNTQWLGNAVAVAIAVILFFALSVPVENTYIDKGNYASLGTDCLFDAIRSRSMAVNLTGTSSNSQQKTKKISEVKPVVVKEEKVLSRLEVTKGTEKTNKIQADEVSHKTIKNGETTPQKKYHLIVASLTNSLDAEQTLKSFKQKGYDDATIIEGNGRFRISLYHYINKSEADTKLKELKKEAQYQGAWLLTSK